VGVSSVTREEVAAALDARRELGQRYEDEIVDGLVEKIERRLDERLDRSGGRVARSRQHDYTLRLALGSIALGVGATAVATSNAHGVGGIVLAIVAWIAITIVNLGYALAGVVRRFVN
jgi:hypothetical protein